MSLIKEGKMCPVSGLICTKEECQGPKGNEFCIKEISKILPRIQFVINAFRGKRELGPTFVLRACLSYEEMLVLAGKLNCDGEFSTGTINLRKYFYKKIGEMIINKK